MSFGDYLTDHVFTLDNLYHALGGAGITALNMAPVYWSELWSLGITLPVTFFAWGYVREVAQSDNDWMAPLRKQHKMWEAVSWGIASACVAVPLTLVRFLD